MQSAGPAEPAVSPPPFPPSPLPAPASPTPPPPRSTKRGTHESKKNANRIKFPRPIHRLQDGSHNPHQTPAAVDRLRLVLGGREAHGFPRLAGAAVPERVVQEPRIDDCYEEEEGGGHRRADDAAYGADALELVVDVHARVSLIVAIHRGSGEGGEGRALVTATATPVCPEWSCSWGNCRRHSIGNRQALCGLLRLPYRPSWSFQLLQRRRGSGYPLFGKQTKSRCSCPPLSLVMTRPPDRRNQEAE